jgi:hypothetical protein
VYHETVMSFKVDKSVLLMTQITDFNGDNAESFSFLLFSV